MHLECEGLHFPSRARIYHGDEVLVASLERGEILGEFTIDPTRG